MVQTCHLRAGVSTSCGCYRSDAARARVKHGLARRGAVASEFGIWAAMLSRCANSNTKEYPRYGGRGIKVCARWQSFKNFLADMGPRPAGMSLDRFPNNDGDYEPGNCRWATATQQGRNRRGNRTVATPLGPMLLVEAAEASGLGVTTLRWRIAAGHPVERMFDRPGVS